MNPRLRALVKIVVAAGVLALLLCGAVLLLLRSNWLRNQVRLRTIAAVEQATGGQVGLRAFEFNWLTLTADFRGFTVHGTEPPSSPPLLTAADVHIAFPWTAVWRREFKISSLSVEQPHLYLLVRPDGTTNIPTPRLNRKRASAFDLTRLHIGHMQLTHGVLECHDRRIPFNLRASGLALGLAYLASQARYDVQLQITSLAQLQGGWQILPTAASLNLHAQLARDELDVEQFQASSPEASLHVTGTVRNFRAPIAELNTTAQLNARLLTPASWWVNFGAGLIHVGGRLHYSPSTSLHFDGRINADSLLLRYPGGRIQNGALAAECVADRTGAACKNVVAHALGGQFRGTADVSNWHLISVRGGIAEADTNRLLAALIRHELPWSGWASGPVQLTAVVNKGDGIVVHTQLHIAPKVQGIPLIGDVFGTYVQAGNKLRFDRLSAQLPATRLDASGDLNRDVALALQSTDVAELAPMLPIIVGSPVPEWPLAFRGSAAHFDGHLTGPVMTPSINGALSLRNFVAARQAWAEASTRLTASETGVELSQVSVKQGSLHVTGSVNAALRRWTFDEREPLAVALGFEGADVAQLWSKYSSTNLPIIRGIASGKLNFAGTWQHPEGDAQMTMRSLDAFGQTLNRLQASLQLNGDNLIVSEGRIDAGPALLRFDGSYHHLHEDWAKGDLAVAVNTNGFPMNALSPVQRFAPGLNGRMEVHGTARVQIAGKHVEPVSADGRANFRRLTFRGVEAGPLELTAVTRSGHLEGILTGALEQLASEKITPEPLTGRINISLAEGNATHAELTVPQVEIASLLKVVPLGLTPSQQPSGRMSGTVTLDGRLASPASLRLALRIDQLILQPPQQAENFALTNAAPVAIDFDGGTARIRSLQLKSRYGQVDVAGSFNYAGAETFSLEMNGQAGLEAFELFDPNVTSTGSALVSAHIRGTVAHPAITGSVRIQDGSFYLHNVPNGLTKVNGTATFTGDRAVIEQLTANSGGGTVKLAGFVNFGVGHAPIYNLKAAAEQVRVRYANAVSATGSGTLQLTGTTENGLLSGDLSIQRVVVNPDADLGTIFAATSASKATPVDQNEFLSGLQMDIRVESAPNLQVSTALSQDVEADVDLRLRGSPDRPLLFGSITANQGQIKVFGAKYSINRGEVTFVNTVRIEPVLDLDIQTVARGVTVDITISGTLNKLNLNYRSDPPLQPKDIIALLTVGQPPSFTPNLQNAQPANNDVSALQAGANTVLGQAISPASNRLSKLFGITNIKIDPLVQGITNTPQARLTVEQQISKNVTVTYVTNLAQTSEQIFRFEWALNPQYSIIAVRDDNGEFGIDFQYKRRFK